MPLPSAVALPANTARATSIGKPPARGVDDDGAGKAAVGLGGIRVGATGAAGGAAGRGTGVAVGVGPIGVGVGGSGGIVEKRGG